MNTEDTMRTEYDLTDGERRKFFGKVDTKDPLIIEDGEASEQSGKEDVLE